MQALSGYKTYIIAALIGIATVAKTLGYLTADQLQTIIGLLGPAAAVTMRMAIGDNGIKSDSASPALLKGQGSTPKN